MSIVVVMIHLVGKKRRRIMREYILVRGINDD